MKAIKDDDGILLLRPGDTVDAVIPIKGKPTPVTGKVIGIAATKEVRVRAALLHRTGERSIWIDYKAITSIRPTSSPGEEMVMLPRGKGVLPSALRTFNAQTPFTPEMSRAVMLWRRVLAIHGRDVAERVLADADVESVCHMTFTSAPRICALCEPLLSS